MCRDRAMSILRACGALNFDRSTYQYTSRRADQTGLERRIRRSARPVCVLAIDACMCSWNARQENIAAPPRFYGLASIPEPLFGAFQCSDERDVMAPGQLCNKLLHKLFIRKCLSKGRMYLRFRAESPVISGKSVEGPWRADETLATGSEGNRITTTV